MQLVMLAVLVTKNVIVHWDQLLVSHPLYSYECSQTSRLGLYVLVLIVLVFHVSYVDVVVVNVRLWL